MYDFRSSSICKYSTEKEKTLSLAGMLFALLAIMLLTSMLQSALLTGAFFLTNFRSLPQITDKEAFLKELSTLLENFYQSDISLLLQLFSTVATIALTLTLCLVILRRSLASLALVRRGAVWQYLIGLVLGALVFSASFGVASLNGSVKLLGIAPSANVGMLITLFFGYVIQAASEEILFRGFLMCDLARRQSPTLAIVLSSLAFALAHSSNTGIGFIAVLNLFLFGVLASILVLRTGSLFGACALHTAWNFTQGHVFGCRVSGLVTDSTVFYSEALPSHKLTNGGAFGPEGGVAVTVVFIVFIVLLLVFPSKKKSSEAD